MNVENIFPLDHLTSRVEKESLLRQKSAVFWLTGLSGSGKSTLAKNIEKKLLEMGHLPFLLDGDNLRNGLNKDLSFTTNDRYENIRRAAEISRLFIDNGIIVIASFISPTPEIRNMARNIIGDKDYNDIYIKCPVEVCEQRDVKGLYKKARKGEIQNFTGINAPFIEPESPDIVIDTSLEEEHASVKVLMDYILSKVKLSNEQL